MVTFQRWLQDHQERHSSGCKTNNRLIWLLKRFTYISEAEKAFQFHISKGDAKEEGHSLSRWLRWWRICLQCRRPEFDPWVGKIPWRRVWLLTPVFWPGKAHGQKSLAGYSPWGCKESDTTERLTLSWDTEVNGREEREKLFWGTTFLSPNDQRWKRT